MFRTMDVQSLNVAAVSKLALFRSSHIASVECDVYIYLPIVEFRNPGDSLYFVRLSNSILLELNSEKY